MKTLLCPASGEPWAAAPSRLAGMEPLQGKGKRWCGRRRTRPEHTGLLAISRGGRNGREPSLAAQIRRYRCFVAAFRSIPRQPWALPAPLSEGTQLFPWASSPSRAGDVSLLSVLLPSSPAETCRRHYLPHAGCNGFFPPPVPESWALP